MSTTGRIFRFIGLGLAIFDIFSMAMDFIGQGFFSFTGFDMLKIAIDSTTSSYGMAEGAAFFIMAFGAIITAAFILLLAATCVRWRGITIFSAISGAFSTIFMLASMAEDMEYVSGGFVIFLLCSIGVVVCSIVAAAVGGSGSSSNNNYYNSGSSTFNSNSGNSGDSPFL